MRALGANKFGRGCDREDEPDQKRCGGTEGHGNRKIKGGSWFLER